MGRNKAAGLDGYPIEIFQVCWDFIKDDMIEMFADFFQKFPGYQKIKLWHDHPSP
jgi:hypothetical protein